MSEGCYIGDDSYPISEIPKNDIVGIINSIDKLVYQIMNHLGINKIDTTDDERANKSELSNIQISLDDLFSNLKEVRNELFILKQAGVSQPIDTKS